MSLVLRDKCQTVLDNAGLNNMHCRINGNKILTISGECGQPIAVIYGIKFARQDPTMREISFAAELLDGFIATHKKKLNTYLRLRRDFLALKEPAKEDTENKIEYQQANYCNSRTRAIFSSPVNEDSIAKYTLYPDEDVKIMFSKKITLDELRNFTPDEARCEIAKKGLKVFDAYYQIKSQMENAQAELNRCDI